MTEILIVSTVTLAEFIIFGAWFWSLGPRNSTLSRPGAYVIGVGTIIAAYTGWLWLMPYTPDKWLLIMALVWFSVVGAVWPVGGRLWLRWQALHDRLAIYEVRDE